MTFTIIHVMGRKQLAKIYTVQSGKTNTTPVYSITTGVSGIPEGSGDAKHGRPTN